uniref:DUF4939 domain-containing protein n=1 Tax=Monopterus albus TaxID=43700 RepID=A0A3Q3IS02_MONAL
QEGKRKPRRDPHSAPHAASPRRDPPIPEPDVFNSSVDKCRGCLLQCRRAFDQQPRTFRTDREKISYVINRVRGKALTWAEAADSSGVLIDRGYHTGGAATGTRSRGWTTR